jgi:hypothetical protein
MNIADRIKTVLLDPRAEWPRIATEPATVQSLYTGWIMLLAAIGPLMILLSTTLFAGALGFGFAFGVRAAIAAYINALIGVAVLSMIVDVLAPSFGGSKDYVRSLKLIAYSFTPVWVAQIALIVPVLGWLVVLAGAIYGFYLFFLGAPLLGRCSLEKAVPYTIVVVLCAIVLSIIIQRILFALIGIGAAMPGSVGMLR